MSTRESNRPAIIPFDATRYLHDDAAIVDYMAAVLESNDNDLLSAALSDVARAKGVRYPVQD
jgi:DNA-binding phage protein